LILIFYFSEIVLGFGCCSSHRMGYPIGEDEGMVMVSCCCHWPLYSKSTIYKRGIQL